MKSLEQYLREANEDFTYTTEQNKTDEHVKGFVRAYIDQPKVELGENSVDVDGNLKSKYADRLTIDDDGKIVVNVDLTKFIEGFVNDVVGKMIDQSVVDLSTSEIESATASKGSNAQAIITYNFDFDADDFSGDGTLAISGIVKDGSIESPVLNFTCQWKQIK